MNFDGPVRVASSAPAGKATVTVSFDAWKDAPVAPTTHTVEVLPPTAATTTEPVSPNLAGSLIHPERKANVWTVRFSADGKRLFTTGYPSGIVQFWDTAARKELRRIDTPAGLRASADYAVLSPDWKTLYVPAGKRTVTRVEKDGKAVYQVHYAGAVRVWDLTTGREGVPLPSEEGCGAFTARISPDGRFLVCGEQRGHESTERPPEELRYLWNLGTKKKVKLVPDSSFPVFAPDGKKAAFAVNDSRTKTSTVKLFDLTTMKELASVTLPVKERSFWPGEFSPDGRLLSVRLAGEQAGLLEIRLLDARNLTERSRIVGKAAAEKPGWGAGLFTPDWKRFVALDGAGNAYVWDVASRNLERTIRLGTDERVWRAVISPDGKTLATSWTPKADPEDEGARDPDPEDLPQPHVTLVDLAGSTPPRVLVAPHGYLGGLAFSPDGKTLAVGGAGAVHLFDLTK